MTLARAFSLGLLVLLAACGADRKGDPGLAVACAVRTCECVPEGVFDAGAAQEVLWQENGDAYCREGYTLRLADVERKVSPGGSKERKGGVRLDVPVPSF